MVFRDFLFPFQKLSFKILKGYVEISEIKFKKHVVKKSL